MILFLHSPESLIIVSLTPLIICTPSFWAEGKQGELRVLTSSECDEKGLWIQSTCKLMLRKEASQE